MKILTLLLFCCISIFPACSYAVRYDGPYEGRVIDADTKQAVEGVVVLGTWSREIITPGGATHNFYDAKETVTDANGDFSIQGLGVLALSNITPMDVSIFKAGYENLGTPWESLKTSKYLIQKKNITWEGNRVIIPLRTLTIKEMRKIGISYGPGIPPDKMKLFTKEINKARIMLGLTPLTHGGNLNE